MYFCREIIFVCAMSMIKITLYLLMALFGAGLVYCLYQATRMIFLGDEFVSPEEETPPEANDNNENQKIDP